jgi:hypothetical protein
MEISFNINCSEVNKRQMKIIKTEIIILSILWLSITSSLYFNYKFDTFFTFGIIGLSIATLTYKKYYDISLSVLILILFFSVFNVVKFSLAFGLNFGLISIPPLIMLMILLFMRKNEILDLKERWFDEENEEVETQKYRNIEFFKNQFKELSEENLELKLKNEQLTIEAQIAINELQSSRQHKNKTLK